MRRRAAALTVGTLLLTVGALLPSSAVAETTVWTFNDGRFGQGVSFQGDAGNNDVTVSLPPTPGAVQFEDPDGVVSGDDPLCQNQSSTVIVCEIYPELMYGWLEGGDDRLQIEMADDDYYAAKISAGAGADRMFGGGDTDVFLGKEGDDLLIGAIEGDRLDGGRGDDRIRGGLGDDRLEGGGDDDRILGGLGNDRVLGQRGSDWLFGGNGRDRLFADDRTPDRAIDCGADADLAFLDPGEAHSHPGCETWAVVTSDDDRSGSGDSIRSSFPAFARRR